MSSPASRFPLPCSHAGWRILALGLAELPSERLPSADRPALKQLKDATWDIASYAAFWRTVQLPSLGPGLLPGLVVMLLLVPQIARGNLGPSPRPSDPFILWPSLWLLGWFALTFALAPLRHASMQRRALRLARHLGLLAGGHS